MLKAWLSENWSRSSLNVCEFKERFIDERIVEDLLTFFYTSKVILTGDNAQSICMAAHFLNIPKLLTSSEQFLSERVSSANVLDLFLLSDRLDLEILRKSCVDCFFENYETVFKDSKLIAFTAENIQMTIKELDKQGNDLKYKEVLFESLISWVEHDLTKRESSLPVLLKCLQLDELSKQFLSGNVITKQIVSGSYPCLKLVMEALAKVSTNNLPPSRALNKLYCFGGQNEAGNYLNSVSNLDITTGKWNQSAPMPVAKAYFAGAVVGSKVYVCGGQTTGGGRSSTVDVFDCTTNAWTALKPMPEARSYTAAAVHNQLIYVVGGYNTNGHSTTSTFRYNPETDEWETLAPTVQNSHYDHQLIEFDDYLYAIGGGTNVVEKYNPEANTWTAVANTAFNHSSFGAASLNGRIYVFSAAGFEVYSPDSNTWRTLPSVLREYNGRTFLEMKGKLYALGGGKNPATNSMFEFDPATERWRQLPDMDVARKYHCSFFINP